MRCFAARVTNALAVSARQSTGQPHNGANPHLAGAKRSGANDIPKKQTRRRDPASRPFKS
jgi:hypothetical protein